MENVTTEQMIPRIRELRKARGLTLGELSSLVHLDISQLSKIERGKARLSFDKAVEIAKVLEIQLDDLRPTNPEAPAA